MTGIELISQERRRQIEEEGFSLEHDDQHLFGELANAAAFYAIPPNMPQSKPSLETAFLEFFSWPWRWDLDWDKKGKHDRIKHLAIAGALCAAEIDRLNRKYGSTKLYAAKRTAKECWFIHISLVLIDVAHYSIHYPKTLFKKIISLFHRKQA